MDDVEATGSSSCRCTAALLPRPLDVSRFIIGAAIAGVLLAPAVIVTGPGGAPPGVAHAQVFSFPGGIPPADFRTDVEIEASAAQVWLVLTNFAAYPIWNPFIYPVKGDARVGNTLEITIHPGTRSITYRATVVAMRPDRELAWFAQSVSGGFFDITYSFTIEPVQANRVRLISRETHTGLASILETSLVKDVQSGLDAMTKAVRNRVELERIFMRPGE
ncbi:MAG TPA: SRPBCC domain-containing protein, partial [bacterium]|nr:SRPBCC domain-containing protein [bacterium]